MSERVRLLHKDCLPPHGGDDDGDGFPRLLGSSRIPTWLLVLGGVALLAYVVFFSFMR